VTYGKTGRRSFFVDQTEVIRFTSENRAATCSDPELPPRAACSRYRQRTPFTLTNSALTLEVKFPACLRRPLVGCWELKGARRRSRADDASVLSEARTRERVRVTTMLCALSIKPLEGSRLRLRRTRSMGIQSIWRWKSLQRRELREKLGY
jgi:hypothetical protein